MTEIASGRQSLTATGLSDTNSKTHSFNLAFLVTQNLVKEYIKVEWINTE
jgi:hypothetical protein